MSESHSTADAWRNHPSYGSAPRLGLQHDEQECTRLVVVSAHPDDESLGAGGLISVAADAGLSVYVVLLTAGEASPYADPEATRHTVATVRLAETEDALARLAPENSLVFLGAPDGEVAASEEQIASSLTELLGDGHRTLVAAPWRHDGHVDHEAAGRAAAAAAAATGARLIEFPLLAWNFLGPDELPWEHVRCLDLDQQRQERKQAAIRAHVSQVGSSPEGSGEEEAPLPARVLAHFTGVVEHYLEVPVSPGDTGDADDPGQASPALAWTVDA